MPSIRVLVVEDDAVQAGAVSHFLEESPEYTVVCVPTLAAATGALAEHRFDVVLLDLNLPDSRGLATLISVHRMAEGSPVVVFTSTGDNATAERAIELGADEYLVKGVVSPTAIRRVVRYSVERGAHRRITDERLEHERALADFGMAALSAADVDQLLDRACHLAARVLRTRWAAFAELTARNVLVVTVAAGRPEEDFSAYPIAVDSPTPIALALRTDEVVVVEDIRADDRVRPGAIHEALGIVSVAAVAVRESGGTARGVLALWHDQPKTIDDHERSFLRSLANIVAATIQRKKSEDALLASRAEMADILRAMPDWIVRVDRHLRICYTNFQTDAVRWDELGCRSRW